MSLEKQNLAEKALWREVINQSMEDLMDPVKSYEVQQRKYEIINWLNHRDFELICNCADLNSNLIRKLMIQLHKLHSGKNKENFSARKNNKGIYFGKKKKTLT
jgi:hypothetical protein